MSRGKESGGKSTFSFEKSSYEKSHVDATRLLEYMRFKSNTFRCVTRAAGGWFSHSVGSETRNEEKTKTIMPVYEMTPILSMEKIVSERRENKNESRV